MKYVKAFTNRNKTLSGTYALTEQEVPDKVLFSL